MGSISGRAVALAYLSMEQMDGWMDWMDGTAELGLEGLAVYVWRYICMYNADRPREEKCLTVFANSAMYS
jgi:hypothetical protein